MSEAITRRLLVSYGVTVVVEPGYYTELQPGLKVQSTGDVNLRRINAIITVGGDGTILWASKYFKYGSIPPIIAFAMVSSSEEESIGNAELLMQFCGCRIRRSAHPWPQSRA